MIEYTGELISRRETKRRGQGNITYLFTLDDYWTIDGAVGGSGAEIINHSCDPNLYSCILRRHILYLSKRVILPGEELTIDYRFSDKVGKVRCRCGSEKCRGTINDEGIGPGAGTRGRSSDALCSRASRSWTPPYARPAPCSSPAPGPYRRYLSRHSGEQK